MFRVKVSLPSFSRIGTKLQASMREAAFEALRGADETVGVEAGRQVKSQGSRLGTTWPDLSPITVKRRAKRYPSTYYGKNASTSGPAQPIGVWTGRLRDLLSKPGQISRRNLVARREYYGGRSADSVTSQRLYWLHAGGIREDKDGVRVQPSRKVFHMQDGTPMPRAAFRTFRLRFTGALQTLMARP